MGLDNGIVLATKHKINLDALPDYLTVEADNWREKYDDYSGFFYYDICYWRKCWNIRSHILGLHPDCDKDNYEYRLENSHVKSLQQILINYLCDISKWEEEYEGGETIWDADCMINHLARDVVNLGWLINFLKEHPTSRVLFYDSY